MYLLKMK